MAIQTGYILQNRYRIVALLGQGGFGAVYRAWDTSLNIPCAVKENFGTSDEAKRQFTREATLLASLRHPNLPRVTDHFVLPQGQYLVMDFVEGEDLDSKLAQASGPLPEDQALLWIHQVCDALNHLHSQNPPIIHRDLKPANIRVTSQGHAMLVDFGIAKEYDPASKTTNAARAITPGYSPPEQYGQGHTDARTDIYALGATLYTLLTGAPPPESVQRTIGARLQSPRTLNPALTPATEAAILKALELVPAVRFQSALEFQRALTAPTPTYFHTVTSTSTLAPSTVAPTLPAPGLKNVVLLAIVAVVSIFLTMAGAAWFLQSINTSKSDPPTEALVVIAPTIEPTEPPTEPPTAIPQPPTLEPTMPPPIDTGVTVDGMKMQYIPAGEFLMGAAASDNQGKPDEKPQHTVNLKAFWIDETEVTNAMFARFVAETNYVTDLERSGVGYTWNGGGWDAVPGIDWRHPIGPSSNPDDYPVVQVSWFDAQAYCDWAGRRLPTEAEWEKAARGEYANLYPWGNQPPDVSYANYDNQRGDLAPVGSYPSGASPYGVLDLAGNAYEWVADWYGGDYYSLSPLEDPQGPPSSAFKVLRGGSWQLWASALRAYGREVSEPHASNSNLGFRCAADEEVLSQRVSSGDGMLTLYVPAGEFAQGSTSADQNQMLSLCPKCRRDSVTDQGPQHTTSLNEFWIDQTEVTNAMFAQFIEATGYQTTAEQKGFGYVLNRSTSSFDKVNGAYWQLPRGLKASYRADNRPGTPVIQVSWNDANAYCQWAGRRLPTEAEWEKAARGTEARMFPWGSDLPDSSLLNFNFNEGQPMPVGSYPSGSSPYGALDMAGNVWEWVLDPYKDTYYAEAPAINPSGPTDGDGHGLRGGSWASEYSIELVYVMTTYRSWNTADASSDVLGFRCAADD